jgi:hypothetical protein
MGWFAMKKFLLSFLVIAFSVSLVRAQEPGGRSKTVWAAVEEQLKKKSADITADDLANLTELKLPHIHLKSFNEHDFAGMTNLKKLHFYSLFHNRGRSTDPIAIDGKVFAKLSSLEELIITWDQLGQLPDDVFSGLTSLKVLEMTNVTLTRLPKSMLELQKIETVYYDGKGMSKEDYETLKSTLGNKLKQTRPK